jgi:hypothetical protein
LVAETEEGVSVTGAGVLVGDVLLGKNVPMIDFAGVVVAVGTGVAITGSGLTCAVLAFVFLRARDLGEGDAVATAVGEAAVSAAALRERFAEGEALALEPGETAASAAAFLRVRRDDGEGEATSVAADEEVAGVVAGDGVAVVAGFVLLWARCFAGEGDVTGTGLAVGVWPSSKEAAVKRASAETRINFQFIVQYPRLFSALGLHAFALITQEFRRRHGQRSHHHGVAQRFHKPRLLRHGLLKRSGLLFARVIH